MQVRPASTYDLARSNGICLMDLRDAPAREFEAICQHVKTMQPYVTVAQQNSDSFSDEELRTLYNQHQGGYLLNMGGSPKEQNLTWDTSLGFWTNLPGLIRSFAEPGEDLPPSLRACQTCCGSCSGICHCWIPTNWISATTLFSAWPTYLAGALEKADRLKAERINQELQEKLCQTFQAEAAIDFASDQDRVLREHIPQVARSHREEILPPSLRAETSGTRGRGGRRN